MVLAPLASCGSGEDPPPQPVTEDLDSPAQTPDPSPPSNVAPALPPAILFDGVMHDFGPVSDVHDLTHTFSFMNTGDSPLEILEVDAACGCTATELTRSEVEPGGVESITVEWDTQGHGRQAKTITIRTSAPVDGTVILTVAVLVSPKPRIPGEHKVESADRALPGFTYVLGISAEGRKS